MFRHLRDITKKYGKYAQISFYILLKNLYNKDKKKSCPSAVRLYR
ncbi:hypothetical protein CLOSYM_03759 [[Clostridium] symbiosum ATCC 14940]|uniref:Uncharacterized protein n=1 Tax=[Clostridium] symbiosum ATCC 14940 TaxID=411472 RepID=A0ABC9TTM4_CLOSY|nr:hypothetical protein CLOSYM_03759 [[Clostridium] symbiosum ATCC 14940]